MINDRDCQALKITSEKTNVRFLVSSLLPLLLLAMMLLPTTALAGGPQPYTAQTAGYDDLLLHRTGFARDANVVGGGPAARVYIVDSTSDASTPGTLRHALEADEPFWIRFAPAMAGNSILVASPIRPKSYKTIDGRMGGLQPVRVRTSAMHGKMIIFDQKLQLIVMNVNFDDGYVLWKKDTEGSEAIHIYGSSHIWLHQNRFARFRDVAVEMDEPISDYVTLSYNLFEMQYQAVVLNSRHADFHHNRCLNTGERCPKVNSPSAGGASLYVYNNLIEYWRTEEVHSIEDPGQYLADSNVYRPRTDALRESGQCDGIEDTWKKPGNRTVGSADTGGCLESRRPHVELGVPSVTFPSFCVAYPEIPASVAIEVASDDLAVQLRNNARPQAYIVDNTCK
jgi:pectate lyase